MPVVQVQRVEKYAGKGLDWINTPMYTLLLSLKTICITLFTGGLVYVVIGVIPTYRETPLEEFPYLHRRMDHHVHPFMPLTAALTGVFALLETFFCQQFWQRISDLYCIVGVIAIMLFSQLHNVPLNRIFRQWTPSNVAHVDIAQLRKKWMRGHYIRTLLAITVYIVAVLVPICMYTLA